MQVTCTLIGYVDLLDFCENWLVCPLVIITQKYMRFQRNSKYFSHNSLEFENNRNIFYCPTSQCIFSGNNKNLKIA